MILVDIYCFQAIKVVDHGVSPKAKLVLFGIYWLISGAAIITLLILPYLHFDHQAKLFKSTIFAIVAGLFFAKNSGLCFFPDR